MKTYIFLKHFTVFTSTAPHQQHVLPNVMELTNQELEGLTLHSIFLGNQKSDRVDRVPE